MSRAIICFTRVPVPGQTKTRLMPVLSAEQCAALHIAFLKDLAKVYSETDADLLVCCTPDEGWQQLEAIFPQAAGMYPQEGADLGERMHNALCRGLELGYEKVLLMGTDVPLVTIDHLEGAFAALDRADVTLAPVPDGGYFLVGAKAPCPALFTGQTYGAGSVFENTCAAAKAAGLTVAPAPGAMDVDTPEDLQALWSRIRGSPSHTAACLAEIFIQKEAYSC